MGHASWGRMVVDSTSGTYTVYVRFRRRGRLAMARAVPSVERAREIVADLRAQRFHGSDDLFIVSDQTGEVVPAKAVKRPTKRGPPPSADELRPAADFVIRGGPLLEKLEGSTPADVPATLALARAARERYMRTWTAQLDLLETNATCSPNTLLRLRRDAAEMERRYLRALSSFEAVLTRFPPRDMEPQVGMGPVA